MKYISVSDVAQRLGNHEKTIRRYINNGQLQAKKIGGQWKIAEEWFDEFSRAQVDKEECSHCEDFCIYMDSDYYESDEPLQVCSILDMRDPRREELLCYLKSLAYDEVMEGAKIKIETQEREGYLRAVIWAAPEVSARLLQKVAIR